MKKAILRTNVTIVNDDGILTGVELNFVSATASAE